MLLAQVPAASESQMSGWLVGMAAIAGVVVLLLTGANQWRQFMSAPVRVKRAPGERFVMRSEHERAEKVLAEQLTEKLKVLTDRIDKHETYTHQRLHDISNAVNTLTIKVASQPTETRLMIDASIAPIMSKLDNIWTTVVGLAQKAGISRGDNPENG